MADENPQGDAKALWQRQQEEPQDVAIASVRRRAAAIEATARRRSLVFRVSIVNNVAICAALAWLRPQTRPFVAVFFLAVSLAQIEALTRSTPVTAPGDAGLMTSLAFLRASLERERAFVCPSVAVVPAAGRGRRARARRRHVGNRRAGAARGAAARRQCRGDLRLCVDQVTTARPTAASRARSVAGSLVGPAAEAEREDRGSRGDGDVLLAVEHVGHRRRLPASDWSGSSTAACR